jgi:sec-independent protein translocase protein TatA
MGIALVVFGAKRLPEIGSSLGKGIREFKNSIKDMKNSIEDVDEPAQPSRQIDAPSSMGETTGARREGEPKKLSE